MCLDPPLIQSPEPVPLAEGVELELVTVEGGTFRFKDRESGPEITVPTFCLGKYPVTNAQYLAFVEATGTHAPEWMEEGSDYNIDTGSDDYYRKMGAATTAASHPVVGVSWDDAVAFCEWLSAKTGDPYGLPSETRWEYAARGGRADDPYEYAGGNKLKEVGWYRENSNGSTHPVGLKLPNTLGLYDLSGNVWEWCADHWHADYQDIPRDGRAWTEGGEENWRVVRGGSWLNNDYFCRVSSRYFSRSTDVRNSDLGFRVARY